MLPMTTLRAWQYIQMDNALASLVSLAQGYSTHALTHYRDNGTGWTVTEVLCHLRDFEYIFWKRVRLMVEEDHPHLPFPDPDALARENDYSAQDAYDVLNDLRAYRQDFIAYLKGLDDGAWQRAGIHPTRGDFTCQDQLFLTTHHDMMHLEQITRILAEQKG